VVSNSVGRILGNQQMGVWPAYGASWEISPGVLGEGENAEGSGPALEEGTQADDPPGRFLMSFPFPQLGLPRALEEALIRCKGNYSLGCACWVALEPPDLGASSPLGTSLHQMHM